MPAGFGGGLVSLGLGLIIESSNVTVLCDFTSARSEIRLKTVEGNRKRPKTIAFNCLLSFPVAFFSHFEFK